MNTSTKLRCLLNGDSMVVAPFILNALHAKIAASLGFDAAVSYTHLTLPTKA